MKKGILISFEGIDGSGKTTQIKLIAKYLRNKGYKVKVVTRSRVSRFIMKLLSDPSLKICSKTELLLHLAIRAQDVQEIILPALKEGKIVIVDRFSDASLAYQGYGRGIEMHFIEQLNEFAVGNIKPDITILLDIDPLEAIKRIKERRKGISRIEKEGVEFMSKVRNGYLKIAKKDYKRFKVIDALKSIEEIHKEIKNTILELISGSL